MKSSFKIFAQSPPCFRRHLVQELKSFGVDIISSDLNCLNEVAFRAEFTKLFEIMHYCRTVEVLKLEIGKPILARGEKELMFNLGKLPWAAFLKPSFYNSDVSLNVKVKSFRSRLYHEKKIEEIVQNFLYRHKKRREDRIARNILIGKATQIKKIDSKPNKIQNILPKELGSVISLYEDPDSKKQMKTQHDQENKDLSLKLNQYNAPFVFIYLLKDKAYILLRLNSESLHKHGLKKNVGWGTFKESMASAILREISPFISNFKIWDPFCGSGTFLLQSMLSVSKFPIRLSNYSEVFDIESLRNFNENGYLEFVNHLKREEEEKMKELIENKEFYLIGNDKAPSEAKNLFENLANFFRKLDDGVQKNTDNTSVAKKNFIPFLKQKNYYNKVQIFNSDFSVIPSLLDIKGYTIITNLPYGHRSKSYMSDALLKNTFERFAKMLKKNSDEFENVFIIYPLGRTRPNFIEISKLPWNVIMELDNSGIQVALWQLDKERIKENVDFCKLEKQAKRIEREKIKEEKQKVKEENMNQRKKRYLSLLHEAKKHTAKMKFNTNNLRKVRQIKRNKEQDFIKKKLEIDNIIKKEESIKKIKDSKSQKSSEIRAEKANSLLKISVQDEAVAKKIEELLKKKAERKLKQIERKKKEFESKSQMTHKKW